MSTYSFTRFASNDRLTKYIDRSGKKPGILSQGLAARTDVASASEFAALINALPSTQCLAYGVTERLSATIAPQAKCTGDAIPRTRDNFSWPKGPGVMFIDIDGKYDADNLPFLKSALYGAMPELEHAPQVWARSSSAGVCVDDGEPSKGGIHAYIFVADAQRIPELGQHLYDALWLTGHGWHILSSGDVPRSLARCLIDQSVYQPERLDYAAPPVLGDGLTRTGESVLDILNNEEPPMGPVEPLTAEQVAQAAVLRRESYEGIKPAVVAERQNVIARALPEKRAAIRARQLASDKGEITPDTPLYMASGVVIEAGAVLDNPSRYAGERLADPLEPEYSNDPRIAMITDKGAIYSHAHGGQVFRIVREMPTAPDNTWLIDPEPADSAIVSACYSHGVYRKEGGMTAACEAVGATRDHAEQVWQRHCASKAQSLHQAAPALCVDSFDDARAYIERGENVFIQAALGSGKTERIGRAAMNRGRRAISVTVTRSLVGTHCRDFGSAHYKAGRQALEAANRISTTVHNLRNVVPDDFGRDDVLLLDEFASIARLLCGESESIMTRAEKERNLDLIADIYRRGVQIVALDGDMTPNAAWIAGKLGLRALKVAETPYPSPAVEMITHETTSAFDADRINRLVKSGEHVVIATDSQRHAEALGRQFAQHKPLVIHGQNTENKRQARFLADVNAGALAERLVIYSPAMTVGVSITSVEAHVVVHQHAGTLDPTGLWQLARRYRRVAGGTIRWHVSPSQLHGQAVATAEDIREDHRNMVTQLNCDASLEAMLANVIELNVTRSNPLRATIGHLVNIGVSLTVSASGEDEGSSEYKQTREDIKGETIEAARTARRANEDEHLKATDEDTPTSERRRIERGLKLSYADLEGDAALPRDIVEACLYDGLLTRVRRQGMVLSRSLGTDLGKLDNDEQSEWLFTTRHRNAQADIVRDVCNDLTDSDGHMTLTARAAQNIADQYRARIHVVYSEISKPKRGITPQSALRWLTSLLHGWGYTKVSSHQSATGERARVQVWDVDQMAFKYAARHVERSPVLPEKCREQNMPETRATGGIEHEHSNASVL